MGRRCETGPQSRWQGGTNQDESARMNTGFGGNMESFGGDLYRFGAHSKSCFPILGKMFIQPPGVVVWEHASRDGCGAFRLRSPSR